MMRYHQFLPTLLLLALFFFSSMQMAVAASQWQSPLLVDHQLVGKVWDSNKQVWLSGERLALELQQYDYVLLGENHDNPDHHLLQAKLISDLAIAGKKPTVVMEMLAVNSWQGQPKNWTKVQSLQQIASQQNLGWSWEIYTPILEVIVQHNLNLIAGNIESKELHAKLMVKINEADEISTQELITEYRITPNAMKALEHSIVESHCGHANADMIQFMTQAQLRRDHVITTALLEQNKPEDKPVVLIAGAGHVRNDYAISAQLLNRHRILSFISIAFIEVQSDLKSPQEYLPKDDAGNLNKVFDILYFTARNTKDDPCVKFRKQLKNMQHRQTPQKVE